MPVQKRAFGAVAVVCAVLLSACATSKSASQTVLSPATTAMNTSAPTAQQVIEQLVVALRSERPMDASFYADASMQSWFGAHGRTSRPSKLRSNVQEDDLVFGDLKLSIAHTTAGQPAAMSFSVMTPGTQRLAGLTADDLTRWLGVPQSAVDMVKSQTDAKPAYPQAAPGQIADSPQLIRDRGAKTHPLGNQDLRWQWKAGTASVEFNASINGDGSVETVYGRQQAN